MCDYDDEKSYAIGNGIKITLSEETHELKWQVLSKLPYFKTLPATSTEIETAFIDINLGDAKGLIICVEKQEIPANYHVQWS